MSFSDSSQILDLLFDQNDGVLTSEYQTPPKNIQQVQPVTTDFGTNDDINDFNLFDLADLDILSDDIFPSLLSEEILNNAEEKALDKSVAKQVQADHDYVSQKSPGSNSDSGISLESMSGSPHSSQCDQSEILMTDEIFLSSGSPGNEDFTKINKDILDYNMVNEYPIEDLNLKDINVNFSSVAADSSTSFLDQIDFQTSSKDISIDFNDVPSSTICDDSISAIDVDTCHTNKTVQIHSYHHSRSSSGDSLPFTMKDCNPDITSTSPSSSNQFPLLRLTDEEKELLSRENITLPTNMPLTKDEEKKLRTVRRKIRNKVSAKESRKRKVEYVDGLEQRVKLCTTENSQLQKKIEVLEKQNMSMMAQLKKLQAMVTSKSKPAQTTTCIMVLLLSFALLVVPNFSPLSGRSGPSTGDHPKSIVMPGKSRSLLFSDEPVPNDEDPYGVTQKPSTPWEEQTPIAQSYKAAGKIEQANIVESDIDKLTDIGRLVDSEVEMEVNDTNDLSSLNMKNSQPIVDGANQNPAIQNQIVADDKTIVNMEIPATVLEANSIEKDL